MLSCGETRSWMVAGFPFSATEPSSDENNKQLCRWSKMRSVRLDRLSLDFKLILLVLLGMLGLPASEIPGCLINVEGLLDG